MIGHKANIFTTVFFCAWMMNNNAMDGELPIMPMIGEFSSIIPLDCRKIIHEECVWKGFVSNGAEKSIKEVANNVGLLSSLNREYRKYFSQDIVLNNMANKMNNALQHFKDKDFYLCYMRAKLERSKEKICQSRLYKAVKLHILNSESDVELGVLLGGNMPLCKLPDHGFDQRYFLNCYDPENRWTWSILQNASEVLARINTMKKGIHFQELLLDFVGVKGQDNDGNFVAKKEQEQKK